VEATCRRTERAFDLFPVAVARVKAEFLFWRSFEVGAFSFIFNFIMGTGRTPFAGFKTLLSSFGAGRPACFLNASKIAPPRSRFVDIPLLSGGGGSETGSD